MSGFCFVKNIILLITLIHQGWCNGSWEDGDLSTLGQRISDSVNRQLAPLQNLGPQITQKVNQQLDQQLGPIRSGKLNRDIQADLQQRLGGLENLGQQIQESVNQGLEPVRAMEMMFKMKDGVGGTTIATHLPGGQKFIIRNYKPFTCSGPISEETGQCDDTLVPFQLKDKKDYCFLKNYSLINNYICFSSGSTFVQVINNQVTCKSTDDQPTLLISVEDYRKMCKDISESVTYKYFANGNDPNHVEIPNRNRHVKCSNNQPGICVFTETSRLPYNSGSNIFVNGQSSQSIVFTS